VSKAREFIDYWIENSVHAAEQARAAGASQDVSELAARCIKAGAELGLTEADLTKEFGDLAAYIRDKLSIANRVEHDRLK